MSTQHTPGPWRVEQATFGFRQPDNGDAMIIAPDLTCPGIVWDYGEEGEANARLIAAAPELLGALRAAVNELPDRCEHEREMAHAAIKAATGDA